MINIANSQLFGEKAILVNFFAN